MLEKKLTHIWIGPKKQPFYWMDTWKNKHPDWNYRVLGNEEYTDTNWELQAQMDSYYRRGMYNGVADMIRYEILYKEGGLLPPADSICYHNISELLTEDKDFCYTVYENEIVKPGHVSPIYACDKENSFIKKLITNLKNLDPDNMKLPWEETGNIFVAKMISICKPKIKIWPSHYFIPEHYTGVRYKGNDKIYAHQLWGTTKGLYK